MSIKNLYMPLQPVWWGYDFMKLNITTFPPKLLDHYRLAGYIVYSASFQAPISRLAQVSTVWWSGRKTRDTSFHFWIFLETGIQRFRVPPSHRAVGTGFRKKVTVVCTAQCLLTVVHRTYWCVAYIFEHLAGVFVWKPCVALHVTTKGQFRGLCRWLWATWL